MKDRFGESAVKRDPQESDRRLRRFIAAADAEAEVETANSPIRDQMGFCFEFWAVKQRILREKYGIEWKTPAEMNPNSIFD